MAGWFPWTGRMTKPMDPRAEQQPGTVVRERLASSTVSLRSPIGGDRTIELLPLDPDRPSVELPPLLELVGMLAWLLGPAIPCLAFIGWQPAVAAAGAGVLLRALNRRAGRSGVAFTEGFLRFQGDDAPALGVQEDDDVRWRWSGWALTGGRKDGARP